MGLNYGVLDKLLEAFYEFPNESFTVRRLSKKTGIPKSTVQGYLRELKSKGLIKKENKAESTLLFKAKKTNYYIERLIESGLIDYLIEKLNPSCIILFGSFRKGESVKESDIDLFAETDKKIEVDLKKFEKRLKHGIQLFAEKDIKNLQPRLLNNVINGIKIYGSFKVK